MGWKSFIGCGQTNNDTVPLGVASTVASSGSSYTSGTGTVSLLLTSTNTFGIGVGDTIYVSGITGTDSNGGLDLAQVNGTKTTITGTSGNTIEFTIASGLTIATITGGNVIHGGNNKCQPFTAYCPIGGPIVTFSWETDTPSSNLATPASVAVTNRSAHTSSGMCFTPYIVSPLLSADLVHRLYINGAAGNQIAKIAASTGYPGNGVIQDVTHTDAIAAGVQAVLSQGWTGATPGTGLAIFTGVHWQADQPGGACVPFTGDTADTANGSASLGATRFFSVSGGMAANGNVGWAQVCMPTAGVWSNLQINLSAPLPTGSGTAATLTSNVSSTFISGATPTAGNQIINIPTTGAVAGILEDATHTDAIPFGYFINTEIADNNTIHWTALGSAWTSTQPNTTPLLMADSPVNCSPPTTPAGRAHIGYTIVRPGHNNSSGSAPTEGPAPIPTAGSFSGLTAVTSTTTGTPLNATSMVNNVQGNQTVQYAGVLGVSADATHSDAMSANLPFQIYYPGGFGASNPISSHTIAFSTPQSGMRLGMMGVG